MDAICTVISVLLDTSYVLCIIGCSGFFATPSSFSSSLLPLNRTKDELVMSSNKQLVEESDLTHNYSSTQVLFYSSLCGICLQTFLNKTLNFLFPGY